MGFGFSLQQFVGLERSQKKLKPFRVKMVEKWIGKVAVVTGSSSGIGAAIFEAFVKSGINVIGLARRVDQTEALIDELGASKGKGYAYKCDVSDQRSVEEAFKWIESKFGTVNILVNNAGITRNVTVLDEDPEAFSKMNEVIDTNFRGLLQCTREAYRLMKKTDDHGLIVNINSVLGHNVLYVGFPLNVYPSSKFAVTALTEAIRQELVTKDDKKIWVTSLSPGYVDTEISNVGGYLPPGQKADIASLSSRDIADSVLYLLSTPYNVNVSELTIRPVGDKM